jgi:hypothetical protein
MTAPAGLPAALAAFQAEMPTVHKGQKANVGTYSYTYADLADVTAAAMPLLTKHGLSFSTCPRQNTTGGYELAGILLHTSGERLEGALPIQGGNAQALGSAITYMRRYLLGCMTGIVTDDDDDGHRAQHRTPAPAQQAPPPPPEDPWAEPGAPMRTNTRGRLFALFAQKGITEQAEQLAGANHILGMAYTSRSQFTEADAKQLIEALKKRPDVETPLPEEPS